MTLKTCDIDAVELPMATAALIMSISLLFQIALFIFTVHHFQKERKYGAIGRLCVASQFSGICFSILQCIFQAIIPVSKVFPPIIICQAFYFGLVSLFALIYVRFSNIL